MATLNFIGFINENVSLSATKKIALLSDFVKQYKYQEFVEDEDGNLTVQNPVSKSEFANKKISRYIIETVNAARLKDARDAIDIEELVLEEV